MTRKLTLLFAAVVVLQALLLAVDHEPSFLFGDSAVYLTTAIGKWIPPDRSFIYGLLLRPAAVWPRSLLPVVLLQAACAAVSSWLVGFCLVRYFSVRFRVAAICSLLCAIEPLQLMAARYILPDSLATSLFALYMTLSFSYLKSASASLLALIQIFAVALVSLRIGFLPVIILMAIMLPLCSRRAASFWKSANRTRNPQAGSLHWMRGVRFVALPLLFSLLLNQGLLFGYRYIYGDMIAKAPAYIYRAGLFMLGYFSPLVEPIDYPVASDRAVIFQNLKFPLHDPQSRLAQRWSEGGLCSAVVKSSGGNEDLADQRAQQTVMHALQRNPAGLLKLAAATYSEYFSRSELQHSLLLEQGRYYHLLLNERAVIQETFALDVETRHFDSLTKWLQSHAFVWCWFLLIFPVLYLLYITQQRFSAAKLVVAVSASLLLIEAIVAVDHPTTRYLIPVAWLTFVAAGSIFKRSRGISALNGIATPLL